MTTDAQATPIAEPKGRSLPWGALCAAVLFAGFFLCTWLVVNPRLFYFSAALDFPPFRSNAEHWRQACGEPGGPVRHAAALLAQSCHIPWAGALVLTALAALPCGALWALYRRGGGEGFGLLSLVPAVLILALECRYVFMAASVLGLAVALTAALAYAACASRFRLASAVLLVALAPALYRAAGGMVLLFGATCAVVALHRRRWAHALLALAVAALAPLLWGMLALALSPQRAYLPLLPFHDLTDPRLPLLQAVLCAYPVLFLAVMLPAGGRAGGASRGHSWRTAASGGFVLASCAAVAWLGPESLARDYLRVEAAARTGDWGAVLAAARMIPAKDYSFGVSFAANRALWHEGQLLDGMFALPQHPLGLLQAPERAVSTLGSDPEGLMALSDVYYDLGRMDEAEHLAHEVLSMGYRPWIADRLARVRIAKGETDSARVFLNALAQDPVYCTGARAMLRDLSAPGGAAGLASNWTTPVDQVGPHTVPEKLMPLVTGGRSNRMALDYLTAWRLLAGDTTGVVALLPTMREQGVTRLPRCCQEAILIQQLHGAAGVDLHGFAVSPETAARFADFLATLRRLDAQPEETARLLDERFGDTYFHYYFSRRPGAGQEGSTP